jgi:predicted HicB family RNase H-like nuclease
MSLMTLDGFHARIDYDEDTDLFRGEILGLTGGADFYGSSPEELRREFRKSLDVFLEVCREKGIEPRRQFSGKFNLRISPQLHEQLALRAQASDKSLNLITQLAPRRPFCGHKVVRTYQSGHGAQRHPVPERPLTA